MMPKEPFTNQGRPTGQFPIDFRDSGSHGGPVRSPPKSGIFYEKLPIISSRRFLLLALERCLRPGTWRSP
jgi:hypothetical protein